MSFTLRDAELKELFEKLSREQKEATILAMLNLASQQQQVPFVTVSASDIDF